MKTVQDYTESILNPDRVDKKKLAINATWTIYVMVVLYAASHTLSFVNTTLSGFFRILGLIGALGVSLNALALPFAIKEWTFDAKQRAAAYFFYIVDFALVLAFVWMNTNLARGTATEAVTWFATNIAPIVFVIPLAAGGVLLILDPENLNKYKIQKAFQEAAIIDLKTEAAVKVIEAQKRSYQKFEQVGAPPVFQEPEKMIAEPWPIPETPFNMHEPSREAEPWKTVEDQYKINPATFRRTPMDFYTDEEAAEEGEIADQFIPKPNGNRPKV